MEKTADPGGRGNGPAVVRFGAFELDLRAGELRKEGRRIRLQEQPFQILRLLLESPGEVVSREELRKGLWPGDTVVEFDHSINAAVKRLRNALRDSAERPRYIETLPRRGYRFIAEVGASDRPKLAEPVAVVPENELPNRQPEPASFRARLHTRPRLLVSVVIAATILVVSAGAWYYSRGARPFAAPLQPLMRLDLDLGNDVPPVSDDGGTAVILSPDGSRLVYVSQSKLFTRRLDQAEATELTETEGARDPFFSPDGQWVAFFARGSLNKVSVQERQVRRLGDGTLADGGSWGEDGNIIAGFDNRLARISSAGGTPTPVTELAPGEIAHRWPQILSGGKAVLFSAYTSMTGVDGASIEAQSLRRDGVRKTLVRGATWGRYVGSGHLVYINKGTLFAVPFDPERLEVHGTPTPVLEEVAYDSALGSALIDFSHTGMLVYQSSKQAGGLVTVQWLDQSGNTRPLLPVPGNYLSPTLSPDASRLALTSAGDIWVYELGRGSMMRLTFGGGYGNPLWTPDGRSIVFRATRGMLWTRADGTGQPQPMTRSDYQQIPWSFSADGKRLAFVEGKSPGNGVLWTVLVENDRAGLRARKAEMFLQQPFARRRRPMFSPDGRWLAYESNESGVNEVYVQAFPDRHDKQQISSGGGTYPAWSRTGHELFFWYGAQNRLMVASYQERGDSFIADRPRVWSEKGPEHFATTRSYDPAPDGKQIVALMSAGTSQAPHARVIFLLNFFDELRRRVP